VHSDPRPPGDLDMATMDGKTRVYCAYMSVVLGTGILAARGASGTSKVPACSNMSFLGCPRWISGTSQRDPRVRQMDPWVLGFVRWILGSQMPIPEPDAALYGRTESQFTPNCSLMSIIVHKSP